MTKTALLTILALLAGEPAQATGVGAGAGAHPGGIGCVQQAALDLFLPGTDDLVREAIVNLESDLLTLTPKDAGPNTIARNQRVIEHLNALPYPASPHRVSFVTETQATEVFHGLREHPVVSIKALAKYDPDDDGICFGRAFAGHLELLYRGVQKDSIRKLWVIGPMDKINWRYHVAVAVRAPDGGWWALDPILNRPARAEEWFAVMEGLSSSRRLQYVTTAADRFIPRPAVNKTGKLRDALELLDLRNYFTDLLYLFRKNGAFSGPRFVPGPHP